MYAYICIRIYVHSFIMDIYMFVYMHLYLYKTCMIYEAS